MKMLHAFAPGSSAETCNDCRLLLSYGKEARQTPGGTEGTNPFDDEADLGAAS